MSLLFDRVPRAQLGTTYQYTGWFLGMVPVYIGDLDDEAPLVTERNGVPTWWFDLVSLLFATFCLAMGVVRPDVQIPFFFKITGVLEQTP